MSDMSAVEQWKLTESVENCWDHGDHQRLSGLANCFLRGEIRDELLFLVRIAKIKEKQ